MEIPIWVWVEEAVGGSPRYAASNSVERLQVPLFYSRSPVQLYLSLNPLHDTRFS